MSSKIKGGGRAILSTESQQAIIDLLMSFDNEVHETYGSNSNNLTAMSAHDKKRAQKKFMKQLIQRHEQRQLQMKFNAAAPAATVASDSNQGGEVASKGNVVKKSTNNLHQHQPANKLPTTTTSSNPNVRIELVEAIFKQQDKNDKKGKKKSKDKDKDKNKSTNSNKKSKSKSNKSSSSESSSSAFTVGTKKLIVLPRTTSIKELLQKSKSKLKLKKTPVRAFIQVASSDDNGGESSSSALFDLDVDLSALDDGTVLFVSVTPAAAAVVDLGSKDEKSKQKGEVDDTDEDGITSDNTTNKQMVIDPLDSVKRAYQQQEAHRYQSNKQLERIDEIVDHDKRSLLGVSRATLPVYMYKQSILDTIGDNQVVVLSGATGSGKSTQVPQFLLESTSNPNEQQTPNTINSYNKRPYIVVTQPRKVAAISLAHRVAEERGCPPPGTRGSSIGYMVRSDRRVDLRSCRIVYMTIGILLRMLVNRKSGAVTANEGDDNEDDGDIVPPLSIDTISHLIIDETHERDVNTDFSLTLLKGMIASPSYPYMPRLILMSATASSELFCSYFTIKGGGAEPASIVVPGKTFPVDCSWLCDCEEFAGQTMINRGGGSNKNGNQTSGNARATDNEEKNDNGGNSAIKLSPRATEQIDNRFIRSLIVKLVQQQQSKGLLDDDTSADDGPYRETGAILVFLPGMGEIESLARCLFEEGTIVSDRNLCKVMKLHSSIPKAEQRYVFQPATKGSVKVVLATNIAETSVTIPDISHVIDTCRVKESRYNSSTRIKELVTVWASHASMKQRAGRAGRTSHGICWRLCSEEFAENDLLPHTVPEMARTPLDELILQVGLLYEQRRDEHNNSMAKDGNENIRAFAPGFKPIKFLSMTPTPPAERSLVQASKHLLEVEALRVVEAAGEEIDWLYRLTPLGYHLSRLPMDAKVGKMLIVGCLLGCLDNALTIAAALSCAKSPFFRGHADPSCIEARDSLVENGFGGKDWPGGTVKSDLIAVIATYRAWLSQKHHSRGKFCFRNALDNVALGEMETLRRQFLDLIVDAGLVSRPDGKETLDEDDCNIASEDALLTSCCLVAGLYPNICSLIRPRRGGPKGGRLLTNESDAACRPSSSSFQRKRVQHASESGKDAYAVYHSKHRSLGTVSSGQKRPPETFLSEVNFVSKFALLLFGGELELVKNAIVVDSWLKFKVSSDEDSIKQNAVLIISLRDLLDEVILEHVVETFSSPEEKAKMVDRHKNIIEVVRGVLSDEG